MSKNDGGPAFPTGFTDAAGFAQEGMSLRDWFAGQVLAGMCANPNMIKENVLLHAGNFDTAYAIADAMLAAREEKR